jgi:hypothetical protein
LRMNENGGVYKGRKTCMKHIMINAWIWEASM